jgi:cytochrome c oxidase cbb3-type subunit III
MKFINYLTSIAGIDIFPLVSLMIFVLFFAALLVYTFCTDKKFIGAMKQLPLDNSNDLEKTL